MSNQTMPGKKDGSLADISKGMEMQNSFYANKIVGKTHHMTQKQTLDEYCYDINKQKGGKPTHKKNINAIMATSNSPHQVDSNIILEDDKEGNNSFNGKKINGMDTEQIQ